MRLLCNGCIPCNSTIYTVQYCLVFVVTIDHFTPKFLCLLPHSSSGSMVIPVRSAIGLLFMTMVEMDIVLTLEYFRNSLLK